jgi:septum formation protein
MIVQPDIPLILASVSPRRRELLSGLGLNFTVIPAHIHEEYRDGESPVPHVCRLAREKGEVLSVRFPDALVISADTIVVFRDHILGKPRDKKDALRMLRMLSGNTHEVITAFSLQCRTRRIFMLEYERSKVTFRTLFETEIHHYVNSGSAQDKAGAYGIQDLHANFVSRIDGCYYNVIGFPLARFTEKWNSLYPPDK